MTQLSGRHRIRKFFLSSLPTRLRQRGGSGEYVLLEGRRLRRLGRSSRRLDPDLAALVSLRTLQWDHCNDILQQTVADAGNDRASELSGDLAAGYYTVAIIDQDATEDPKLVSDSRIAAVTNRGRTGTVDLGDDAHRLREARLCGVPQSPKRELVAFEA